MSDLVLVLALFALVAGALVGSIGLALGLSLTLGGRGLPRTPPQATRRNGAHHPGFGS